MQTRQAHMAVHTTALLFGLTGIFGELAQASPMAITAGRAVFAAIVLALLQALPRQPAKVIHWSRDQVSTVILAGAFLAIHWVTFFLSIKTSSIAIATLGFASFPAFITLLEGFLFKERTPVSEWLVVALVSIGLVLVIPHFDFQNEATKGFIWAVISGFSFALFTLTNRRQAGRLSARRLALWENVVVAVLTLPWAATGFLSLRGIDWLWIALLGIMCTAIAHFLLVLSLQRIKAHTAGIVIALEPVYAIFFAAILFAQYPSLRILTGGVLIIVAIVYSGLKPAPKTKES